MQLWQWQWCNELTSDQAWLVRCWALQTLALHWRTEASARVRSERSNYQQGIKNVYFFAEIIIRMIGIQEDVLNMFLVSHFMILISVAVLAIAFSLLLFLKMNQGSINVFLYNTINILYLVTGQRYESRGWFGGSRPAPARVYEEPRQRGFFARLTRFAD